MEISPETKAQLIADIEKGDDAALTGMMVALQQCLGLNKNPNIVFVEFTLSQLEYLEAWGEKLNGTGIDTLIRMMVDTMMRMNPQLGK